jgi:hypothetical protein
MKKTKELVRFIAILSLLFVAVPGAVSAQDPVKDTSAVVADDIDFDSLEDLDALMDDLEAFMDSILRPRSFLAVNISLTQGYFNYKGTGTTRIESVSTPTYSPFLAYYHKSGFGIAGTGFLMNDRGDLNFYQFSLSPSFDYLRDLRLATGISYTKYFSRDSLDFYVSPLTNELSAYFTWRKSWLRPTIMANYAWGSREELDMRLAFIERLWLRRRILNWLQQNYDRNISDVSVTLSVLHDFYFLKMLGKKDYARITPQVAFTAGTQQFGFNQRLNNYTLQRISRADLLSSSREYDLDGNREFKPLSVSFTLRAEYGIGKFFVQPQLLMDYFIQAKEKPLSTIFAVNAGFNF